MTKVWHVASSAQLSNLDGVRNGHESCLHQLIGVLGTVNITVASVTVAVFPDKAEAIVTMVGYVEQVEPLTRRK